MRDFRSSSARPAESRRSRSSISRSRRRATGPAGPVGFARGASQKAGLTKWRKAQAAIRAAVAHSAAMAKAGHPGCQCPAVPEIGQIVISQAGGTELQSTGQRRRCPYIMRPGPQPQAQGREWTMGDREAVDFFGADRRMVELQAAHSRQQMPVKLRRPCLASSSEHCYEVARRHGVQPFPAEVRQGVRLSFQHAFRYLPRARLQARRPAVVRAWRERSGRRRAIGWISAKPSGHCRSRRSGASRRAPSACDSPQRAGRRSSIRVRQNRRGKRLPVQPEMAVEIADRAGLPEMLDPM